MEDRDSQGTREVLRGIADEIRPDFEKIVSELGREQVEANIMAGLRRMHERAKALGRPSGAAIAAAEFGIDLDANPVNAAPSD